METSTKHLHIVSFDIPYPANYGGVIDVFYKIKALHSIGIKIHLHCYEYGRLHAKELKKYCHSVHYYRRYKGLRYFISRKPYIVNTRSNKKLLNILTKDNYPILFEGIHSTFFINNCELKKRIKIVRTHNIEHEYYKNLSEIERNYFNKYFFKSEAKKLIKYEPVLKNATKIAAISKNDFVYFNKKYSNTELLPAFHQYEKVDIKKGKGFYVFYHGNLSVGENVVAALFLINNVFKNLEIPLIIAGKNPNKRIKNAALNNTNIQIIANPDNSMMSNLISEAQINILPTFQGTGIKLKLLASLFTGRHCITNLTMVKNTGLESLCCVKNTSREMAEEVKRLFNIEFDQKEIKKREKILSKSFCNTNNAKIIENLISG
ncbi:MAG: glycosyltransferase [Bacteroidetes bacterium]|nr:glycosyltransferase [Bacteroidota bacterium]